jgi:hypothetical protein
MAQVMDVNLVKPCLHAGRPEDAVGPLVAVVREREDRVGRPMVKPEPVLSVELGERRRDRHITCAQLRLQPPLLAHGDPPLRQAEVDTEQRLRLSDAQASEKHDVDLDGEIGGQTPAIFRVRPGALEVFVPEPQVARV